jgi:chemotaxis response regulator CheB
VETMPQEAIDRGAADRVLTLEQIGQRLAQFSE